MFSSLHAKDSVSVGILNGPSSIPTAKLMEDNADAQFTLYATPQQLLPKLIKGEVDIGFLPANVAAKAYRSSNGAIQCTGITAYGGLFIISRDNSVSSIKDLAGKTVYVAGHGATPEYIMRYLLKANGLEADTSGGVTLDFSLTSAEIPAMIISGKADYALVPEPFATLSSMKDEQIKTVIDVQSEYQKATGAMDLYPITVMVVNKNFAKTKRRALMKFLEQYNEAANWTNENPQQAGALVEKHTLGLAPQVVAKSIPYSGFVWKKASEAIGDIEALLQIFLDFDKDSIGGTLPDDDFYWK